MFGGRCFFPRKAMNYIKGILSGLAAIFLAEFISDPIFRGLFSQNKATGLAALEAGLTESIVSPRFWLLAILLSAFFFWASRLGNKVLRIILFWIPTLAVSALGVATTALLTFALIRLRHL
jgi:hypothetical protein